MHDDFMGWDHDTDDAGPVLLHKEVRATCQQIARRVRELGLSRRIRGKGFQPKLAVNSNAPVNQANE